MKAVKRVKHISRRLRRFPRANEAVSALEYAILAGVVAVGIGGALLGFGNTITTTVGSIFTSVQDIADTAPGAGP